MSDQDTKIVKIEWITIERHDGYFRVPVDFDQDDYVLGDAMADHDEETFVYCERDHFEVYDQQPPPGSNVQVIELDLEGCEAG